MSKVPYIHELNGTKILAERAANTRSGVPIDEVLAQALTFRLLVVLQNQSLPQITGDCGLIVYNTGASAVTITGGSLSSSIPAGTCKLFICVNGVWSYVAPMLPDVGANDTNKTLVTDSNGQVSWGVVAESEIPLGSGESLGLVYDPPAE